MKVFELRTKYALTSDQVQTLLNECEMPFVIKKYARIFDEQELKNWSVVYMGKHKQLVSRFYIGLSMHNINPYSSTVTELSIILGVESNSFRRFNGNQGMPKLRNSANYDIYEVLSWFEKKEMTILYDKLLAFIKGVKYSPRPRKAKKKLEFYQKVETAYRNISLNSDGNVTVEDSEKTLRVHMPLEAFCVESLV